MCPMRSRPIEGEIRMPDADELAKFIIELSENPAKAREYQADPDAVIDAAGLSEETARLLKSGVAEFRSSVFQAAAARAETVTVHTVTNTNINETTTVN